MTRYSHGISTETVSGEFNEEEVRKSIEEERGQQRKKESDRDKVSEDLYYTWIAP